MPHLRPLFTFAVLSLGLGMASPAFAAPTLDDIKLGQPVSGPKVKQAHLEGRVVVFVYWGQKTPRNVEAIPYLVKLQSQYPRQKLLMIVNDGEGGADALSVGKLWRKYKGGDLVTVIQEGGLSDVALSAVDVDGRVLPLIFVFDAFGKYQMFDNPGARVDAAVAAAFKASPGPAAVAKLNAVEGKAKKLFGGDIPRELMAMAIQAADMSRPVAPSLAALKKMAQSKSPQAARAQAMTEAIANAIPALFDKALANAQAEPATAWEQMEQLSKWAPETPEGANARKQLDDWRKDAAFNKELEADRVWLKLKTQADLVEFGIDPEAKPTKAMEEHFGVLIKKHPASHALKKAFEMAEEWKLDDVTGRADKFKPREKETAADDPKNLPDVLPIPDEPYVPYYKK